MNRRYGVGAVFLDTLQFIIAAAAHLILSASALWCSPALGASVALPRLDTGSAMWNTEHVM